MEYRVQELEKQVEINEREIKWLEKQVERNDKEIRELEIALAYRLKILKEQVKHLNKQ